MNTILTDAKALHEEIVRHRRWLHSHAEVGFDLKQTKEYVRRELTQMGYCPTDCGKAGLVALAGGKKAGKVFLLRADMDALPMAEESGVEFASGTGAMHACGHEMHTAMLLGAAKLLKQREAQIHGTVKLMFQPAEEIFEGGKDMIARGVLDDPRPDAAIMIHVTAGLPMPAGTVIVSAPGVTAPAADYFTIHVRGKGCHGSAPHNGVDALTAAAHILIALQEIHARELPAAEEAVLTVGTFRGGTADNAIADSAVLGGTMRSYDETVRSFLKERLQTIACCVAQAYRAKAQVEFGSGCPTLVNDPDLAAKAKVYLTQTLGSRFVLSAADFGRPSRGGGSEDFAYVSQQIPALMLALAAGEPGKGYTYPLHHPKVTLDESALSCGTAAFVAMALGWLDEHR